MNVLDLAMNHGLQPKHVSSAKGGEFASACPMCGGNDRFRIWPEQNAGTGSYWCRQCGVHGDRIQFVIETKGVKYPEACRITGDVPADRKTSSFGYKATPVIKPIVEKPVYHPKEKSQASGVVDGDRWAEHAEKLVGWAAKRLPGSDGETLLRSKGIGADTAEKFRLGWISEDIYRQRESWGLPEVMSEKTGKPKRLWFPAGLVIPNMVPLLDGRQTIDRIRIRRPDGEPRYYRIPGPDSRQLITGTPGRFALVVESELDAMLMDQLVGNVMGIIAIGTSHAKPDKHAQAVLSAANSIIVALDNDEAGQSAFPWWRENYPRVVWHPVPAGKDPSEAHQQKIDLHAWAISGLPYGFRSALSQAARRAKSQSVNTAKTESREFSEPDHDRHDAIDADDPALKTSVTAAVSVQEPIAELQSLLSKNRAITITVTASRLSLSAPSDWRRRHEQTFSRISRLIYFDSDVFGYLHAHGSNNITANNLLEARQ